MRNPLLSKVIPGSVLASAFLAGCGGGGSITFSSSFETEGTVSSSIAAAPVTIPASGTAQTVSVGGVEALLPPIPAAVPAGTPLALFGVGTNPLGPVEAYETSPSRSPIGAYIWQEGQAPFFVSGLVTRNGLSQPVVLTPGKWHIEMNPCYVYKIADPSNRMTVQKIRFNFVVDAQGHHSLPRVTGKWPRDGSTMTAENSAIGIVDNAFLNKPCKLTIEVPGRTLSKSAKYKVYNSTEAGADFRDISTPPNHITVPAEKGLSLVTFDSGF